METITIEVTQENIDCGIAKNCELCPVAAALERVFGVPVTVGLNDCLVREPGGLRRYALPLVVTQWILAFDRGQESSPITFELEGAGTLP